MATTKQKGRGADTHTTPTTEANDITLTGPASEPRIDSRLLAQYLGNTHQHVRELIEQHLKHFHRFGVLRVQTGKPGSVAGGRPERFALLNEDQAYFLLSLSRNTERVVELKANLVLAFREVRQRLDIHSREYLPTYHALHDDIARLAQGSPHERFVHVNVNRAINNAIGIESGQRHTLALPEQSALVVAQAVASRAMALAHDHHDGYAAAKQALEGLSRALEVSHA